MTVTNIRVLFSRKKQPAQYEEANPLIEFNAVVEPGQNHRAIAAALMLDAAELVYTTIGQKDAVTRVRADLGAIIDEDEGDAEPSTGTTSAEAQAEGNAQRRKRRTKAEMEAAKAAETAAQPATAAPTPASTSEAPTASAETATASPAPAQPTAAPSAPAEPPKPAEAAPAADLLLDGIDQAGRDIIASPVAMQKWVSDKINGKKIGVEQYRAIVSEVSGGKAMKTVDLDTAQRVAAYKRVLELTNSTPKVDAVDLTSI